MLNLASMPLKAYFTEPLPWSTNNLIQTPQGCYTNITLCAESTLTLFRNQSNFGEISFPSVPEPDINPTQYVVKMPYALLYTKQLNQLALAVANRQCNVSEFQGGGLLQLLGFTGSHFALWATEGPNGNIMHVGQAILQPSTPWLAFKFIYRLCLSSYIVRCMWKEYYCHYNNLAGNLRLFGIKNAPKASTFEIIAGDPTSMIVLNPAISALFIVDFWLSVDFAFMAFFQVGEIVEITQFIAACLYLSRSLWFAYGALNMISYILKKFHYEQNFDAVDPTWTAIAVGMIAGPFTKLQLHFELFVRVYNFLSTCIADDDHVIEISLSAAAYIFFIGIIPVLYGFLQFRCLKVLRLPMCQKVTPYSSHLNNNFKNQVALQLSLFNFKKITIVSTGGSIYNLFRFNSKFKKQLGIRQHDSDCYIKWENRHDEWQCMRLSLQSCIDFQPQLPLECTTESCAFGRVEMSPLKVIQGSNLSPWIC